MRALVQGLRLSQSASIHMNLFDDAGKVSDPSLVTEESEALTSHTNPTAVPMANQELPDRKYSITAIGRG